MSECRGGARSWCSSLFLRPPVARLRPQLPDVLNRFASLSSRALMLTLVVGRVVAFVPGSDVRCAIAVVPAPPPLPNHLCILGKEGEYVPPASPYPEAMVVT